MKSWNTPVVEEMNINETANGFFCYDKEICIFTHEHTCNENKKDDTPVTPEDDPNEMSA